MKLKTQFPFRSTHTRSAEAKKRRNAEYKRRVKEKRDQQRVIKAEKELNKDEKIRELERKNALLIRTFPAGTQRYFDVDMWLILRC